MSTQYVTQCPICRRLIGEWEGEARAPSSDIRIMRLYISHLTRAHPEKLSDDVPEKCPLCDYQPQEPRKRRYLLHLASVHMEELEKFLEAHGLTPEVRAIELPDEVLAVNEREVVLAEVKDGKVVCVRCGETFEDEEEARRHLLTHPGVRTLSFREIGGRRVARGLAFPTELYEEVRRSFDAAESVPVEPRTMPPPEGPEEADMGGEGEEYSREPLGPYIDRRMEESHGEAKEEFEPPARARAQKEEVDDEVGDYFPKPEESGEPPAEPSGGKGHRLWVWAAALAGGGLLLFGLIRALRKGGLSALSLGRVSAPPQGQSGGSASPSASTNSSKTTQPQGRHEVIQASDGKRYIVLPDGRGIIPEEFGDMADKFL